MRHLIDGKTYEAIASITHAAASILGLDDGGRYADVYRRSNGRYLLCAGTLAAITDLITELSDRSIEGADGYNESPANKAICRRNVARNMRLHGIQPRR